MESIKEIYRIGMGPSSSHTMGPRKAAQIFLTRNPEAASYQVTLYGSLAATGKGHLTDKAILDVLGAKRTELLWKPEEQKPYHTNALVFKSFSPDDQWLIYSIGGGALYDATDPIKATPVYDLRSMDQILQWAQKSGRTLWEYVEQCEGPSIWDFLAEIWQAMKESIYRGLEQEGSLPGQLHLARKASSYYAKALNTGEFFQKLTLAFAYALAVSEENAGGGTIVTAPTCG
ncbi:MAG: serine dehydratase, partial [Desulfobacteraceae bacterium]